MSLYKAFEFFTELIEQHIDILNYDKRDFYFMMEGIILAILMNHYYWLRIEPHTKPKILYWSGL